MHTKELDRTRHSKNVTCYQCRRMDGHSLDECGEISLRCTAYKKMGHLARVCKLTKKPHRCSNWNSNLKSSKNPKRSDKKAHNLRAGWINEETSSDDEKEPVYSRNKQDSSVLVNLNGWKTKMILILHVSTTSFSLNCTNLNSNIMNWKNQKAICCLWTKGCIKLKGLFCCYS